MIHAATGLFEQICDMQNIQLAFLKAYKTSDPDFRYIEMNPHLYLQNLQQILWNHKYVCSDYKHFTVYEPNTKKHRAITMLPARDRIVHHAFDNVVSPIFYQKFDRYAFACIPGRGTTVVAEVFANFLYVVHQSWGDNVWVLKGDIHHYFQSIDHIMLYNETAKYINDIATLDLLWTIIKSNGAQTPEENDKGVPIGNLPSQLFANIMGNVLDNYIRQELHPVFYMRYMDDFVIAANSYQELAVYMEKIKLFLAIVMKLELNKNSTIVYAKNGVPFIGRVFYFDHYVPRKSNKRILTKSVEDYLKGDIPIEDFYPAFTSRIGSMVHTDAYDYIINLTSRLHEDSINKMQDDPYTKNILQYMQAESFVPISKSREDYAISFSETS